MDLATFAVEAEIEEKYWWFVGRRKLFSREIKNLLLEPNASIMDVGTSTGTNLRMLQELGYKTVIGLDNSQVAIDFTARKGLGVVAQGDICAMPFEAELFDLVLATDVIEHVEDDAAALGEITRVLKPGGAALITVPAFPSMWGLQDEVAHHYRRYRMAPLQDQVIRAGLLVERSYYFNYLLFAPIWVARRVIKLFDIKLRSESEVRTPALDWLLNVIFSLDIRTAPYLRPPFGVSALVLARKPALEEVAADA